MALARCLLPLLLLLGWLPAAAQEPSLEEALQGFDAIPAEPRAGDLDAVLQGFDDTPAAAAPAEPAVADSTHRLSGSVGLSAVHAFAHRAGRPGSGYQGLARLRARLDLEYEQDPHPDWRLHADGHAWHDLVYDLLDRDWPAAVEDAYRQEVELGSVWLRGRLGPALDLKVGRQIVVWGKSDNLRVTDVLNPLDQREIGMVDIEDLRLPVTMTRLDAYAGPWTLSGLLLHEIRFDETPPPGGEFYPLPAAPPPERVPADSLANTEFALALSGVFSGWDLSLYAARLFDDRAYLTRDQTGALERRHARVSMFGAAWVMAAGNWLWKTELAHFRGLRVDGMPNRQTRRSDLMLGFEYSGFTDTTLGLEIVDRHLHDYHPLPLPLAAARDTWQAALRWQSDHLHDRLHLTLLVTALDLSDNGAGFARASAEYELTDALDLRAGLVLYQAGERPPLSRLGDNDRLFLEAEYSF